MQLALCLGLITKGVVREISSTVCKRVEVPGCIDDLIEGTDSLRFEYKK